MLQKDSSMTSSPIRKPGTKLSLMVALKYLTTSLISSSKPASSLKRVCNVRFFSRKQIMEYQPFKTKQLTTDDSRLTISELAIIKIVIEPPIIHKFPVSSLLNNLTVIHNENRISIFDSTQPVGNNKAGSTLH